MIGLYVEHFLSRSTCLPSINNRRQSLILRCAVRQQVSLFSDLYLAVKVINSLPVPIQKTKSIHAFKTQLKFFLLFNSSLALAPVDMLINARSSLLTLWSHVNCHSYNYTTRLQLVTRFYYTISDLGKALPCLTLKKSVVDPASRLPYRISVCFAKSSTFWIGVNIRSTVKKAARLAVYDDMMMRVKNHHALPTMRPDNDLSKTQTQA